MQLGKIGILEPEGFSAAAIAMLRSQFDVHVYKGECLAEFLSDIQVLFIRLAFRLDDEFFAQAPCLQVICTPTTGLNHIDQKEAYRRGIQILSLKGEQEFLMNIRATPEHTFGLLLALLRNYRGAFLSSEHVGWDRDRFRGRELCGKTVGLIGFGRVGKILAGYVQAFGAHCIYYDPDLDVETMAKVIRVDSLEDLITPADILVLCASFSEENRGFIGKRQIDLMRGKYFINTARGELIDESYLTDTIRKGEMAGVALDVLNDENNIEARLPELVELSRIHNFIVTPHIAGATVESMEKTEVFMVQKLLRFLKESEKAELKT